MSYSDQSMFRWAYPQMQSIINIDRGCKIFQVYKKALVSLHIDDNKITFGGHEEHKFGTYVRNEETGSNPVIIHAPGPTQYTKKWKDVCNTVLSNLKPVKKTADFSVMTWYSYKDNRESWLSKSLGMMGIEYTRMGAGIGKWEHIYAVQLMIDFIKQCKSKYIIALDYNDVIISGSLNDAVDRLKGMKCSVLYNGEPCADDIGDPKWSRMPVMADCFKLEDSFDNKYSYLNGGCVIGERDALLEVCHKMMSCRAFEGYAVRMCDQLMARWTYPQLYPMMDIDRNCDIFQVYINTNKKTSVQIKDNNIIFDGQE
jgi:hypothetical protein